MTRMAAILAIVSAVAPPVRAADPPLLPATSAQALAAELSGERARRDVDVLARHHRMRGSRGFHAAAEHVLAELRAAGLEEARIERFPTDGRRFYGTQRGRRAWDADFAELWELDERGARLRRIASWEAMPMSLAQDSESGEATAELLDVGEGTRESDYAGKTVEGRMVLAAAQPGEVARLAVERHGAAGIVSYAQNQRTAWWGEDGSLVRWGHLDSFANRPTFAFMVNPAQARAWRDRLARGETVRLHGKVVAGQHDGAYEVVTAALTGADPARRSEEIVFSCHLDHPSPGANDNASGCAAILEVARTLAALVKQQRLPRPARTLRWVFPPEIEGTLALLGGRPELAARIKAAVHMDMVGGGEATKAVFHVTRGPASLPSFANDVAETIADFVNRETEAHAAGRGSAYPLVAAGGDRRALQAEMAEFSLGSDHQVYADSSFGIPAVYLNDWPDRYIHTDRDRPENIDATKLERAAFIGAATALVLADASGAHAEAILEAVRACSLRRTARTLERRQGLPPAEVDALLRFHLLHESAVLQSMERFLAPPPAVRKKGAELMAATSALLGPVAAAPSGPDQGQRIWHRNAEPKGPLSAFGYDYFTDRFGTEKAASLRLLRHVGLRGEGGAYAYEALNLLDGRRTAQDVRDALSAIYGPVPLDVVLEYLTALEEIGIAARN